MKTLYYAYSKKHTYIRYTLVVHRYILYVKLKLINETDLIDVYRIRKTTQSLNNRLSRMRDKSE